METYRMKDMTFAGLAKIVIKDWNDISPRAKSCLSAMEELANRKNNFPRRWESRKARRRSRS